MRNKHSLVRPGKWELACITYKLRGEPKPLDAINGVLVKDEKERRRVEKYLKELYEFQSEEDYQGFLDGFIVRNNGKRVKPKVKDKKRLKINQS